jgi:hypothetical protein
MMTDYKKLLDDTSRKLRKALQHLEYSSNKIGNLSADATRLDEESLETWESFSTRFSRVADIFLTKYLRTRVLMNDLGFTGTLRDFVNQGEKLGIVDSADAWMAIRELRNISAHDYSEEELSEFFERLKQESGRLLKLKLMIK